MIGSIDRNKILQTMEEMKISTKLIRIRAFTMRELKTCIRVNGVQIEVFVISKGGWIVGTII